MNKIRPIAIYLPQFHLIPENDEAWGKGFTEWTNVTKAKPLFHGHKQPKLPTDLGFYDLRVHETRVAQAELAKSYHISGFAYYHYWFGNGKQVLDRPIKEIHKMKEPDFPFCIAWANQSWTGRWHGLNDKIILEQKYLGEEDDKLHFQTILPLLKDKRYILHQGRPIVIIYRPKEHPYLNKFTQLWKELARESGLGEIYFLGTIGSDMYIPEGLDGGILQENYFKYPNYGFIDGLLKKLTGKKMAALIDNARYGVETHNYSEVIRESNNYQLPQNVFPTILTGWDNTPRSGKRGVVLRNYTPKTFQKHVMKVRKQLEMSHNFDTLCFVKSWNEWAEGNYLEPDQEYGHDFLKIVKEHF